MRNCKWWSFFSKYRGLVLVISLFSLPLQAVVNAEGTRVVFNADDTVVSLALVNSEKQPTLVQVWTDEGDPRVSPEKARTPVVVVPPMFRMDPGEIRSLRLQLASRTGLAQDRESLFWLNIYQVPPNTKADKQSEAKKVILPLRIRMKVFIRPAGIGSPEEKEGERLSFSAAEQDGNAGLTIINPGPWHMTLTGMEWGGLKVEDVMVSPKSSVFAPQTKGRKDGTRLTYQVINDTGYRWVYEKTL